MRRSAYLAGGVLIATALSGFVRYARTATAQDTGGPRTRVEGVLTFIAYDGMDSTIGLKPENGPVREIRLRQFPATHLTLMLQLLNGGNRVAYEVARDNSANFFPAMIYAHEAVPPRR